MSRNTWIAVVAAVVLLVLGVWKSTAPAERGILRMSFAEVDTGSIDRVELTGKSPCTLARAGESWTVDGKEADANAVKALLEAIPKIVSSDQVTASDTRFSELGVDDAAGTHVKALAGGRTVADFVVGKAGGGGVNVLASGEVYFVAKVFPATFAREKKAWGARKLFPDPLAQVNRLEVRRDTEKPWALTKNSEVWSLEDPSILPKGFRFDANAARALVSAVVNTQADELPDVDPGPAATGVDGESATRFLFVVGTSGAPARELVLGTQKDATAKTVWARASTRPYAVLLAGQTADALRKAPTDLRDLSLMSFDRTKVNRIAVDDGTNRLVLAKGKDGWKLESHSEKLPEGFELDPSAADRKIAALAGARAQRVAAAGAAFVASGAKVVATLDGGSTVTLAFGATRKDESGAETIDVRGNADGLVYAASPALKTSLTAGVASLRKQVRPDSGGFDPRQLQNLPPEVREAFLRQQAQQQPH